MIGTWSKNSYGADCLVNGNTAFVVDYQVHNEEEPGVWVVWFYIYSPDGGVNQECWVGTTFNREGAMRLAEILSEMEAENDGDD